MIALDWMVAAAATAKAATIERAIEEALQGGVCGVRVYNHPDGSTTAMVDPTVPYGQIFEHDATML